MKNFPFFTISTPHYIHTFKMILIDDDDHSKTKQKIPRNDKVNLFNQCKPMTNRIKTTTKFNILQQCCPLSRKKHQQQCF